MNSNLITVLPNTDPSTGAPSTPGALVFRDAESTPKTFKLEAPSAITTSYVWRAPALDAAGCVQSDGAGNLSVSGCGGFFTLTGSNLSPTGVYNILPNGSATLGSASVNWATAYIGTVAVFSSVAFENTMPTVIQRLGYDSSTGGTAFVNNLATRVFGITETGGAVSYGDLLPGTNNLYNLGNSSTPLRWANISTVNLDISGTCTGCPSSTNYWSLSGSTLTPVGTYDVLPTGSASLGSAATNWANAYIGTVAVFSSVAFQNAIPSLVQRLGYDSSTGGVTFINNVATRVFGITQTGGAVSYGTFEPSANNAFSNGTTSLRWSEVDTVNLNITGTCVGCPGATYTSSSPIVLTGSNFACSTCLVTGGGQTISGSDETINVNLLTGGGKNIGSGSQFWNNIFGTSVVTGGLSLENGTSLVQRLGYDSSTGGVAFVNNVAARVFGITQTGGAVTYGPIEPATTVTYDLGTTGLYFNNAYINTVNAATAVISGIYDVAGGFFGQDATGGLALSLAAGGTCTIFFKGGILYAKSGC